MTRVLRLPSGCSLYCSLDDFIDVRLGRTTSHLHVHPNASLYSSRNSSSSEAHISTTSFPSTPVQNYPPSSSLFSPPVEVESHQSRSARIRAFRAFQRASPEERERMRQEMHATSPGAPGTNGTTWTAVHLLSPEEVKSLFADVVEGLAFLVRMTSIKHQSVPLTSTLFQHNKSILHLDLKPGNVLLTWDEGRLT